MAANQNAAIDVLFGAQPIGNIGILSFHRGSTLKFLKNFWTFFLLNFGQCHGVIISLQPIRNILEKLRETCKFVCLLVFAWAVMPGRSYPCLLVLADPARLGRSVRMMAPPPAAHTCFEGALFGPCRSTHAFKTNNNKNRFLRISRHAWNDFWLVEQKIITPWRCPKFRK